MLNALRLPTVKRLWPEFCERADKEGWPARRLLASLYEFEFQLDERAQRRIQRQLAGVRLPQRKTLDSFDFAAVPTVAQARARALAEGDGWLQEGKNLLAFGPPGVGKTHLVAAIGHELVPRPSRLQGPDGQGLRPDPAAPWSAAGARAHPGDREALEVRPCSVPSSTK